MDCHWPGWTCCTRPSPSASWSSSPSRSTSGSGRNAHDFTPRNRELRYVRSLRWFHHLRSRFRGDPEMNGPSSDQQPVLEARGLIKRFGNVVGLAGVDLELYPDEVLAIIGDNGAGKSTLIKCLSGAHVPDAGEILVNGEQVEFENPQDARRAGIE